MDQRRAPRITTELPASVTTKFEAARVRVSNLSTGGAFVATGPGDWVPPVGTGLQFKMRLPVGFWISGTATVRWVGEGPAHGYGIQFGHLQDYDMTFLEQTVEEGLSRGKHVEAEVLAKFRVETRGRALVIALSGGLDEAEGRALAREIARGANQLPSRGARVFLNATRFSASPASAVSKLARGLESLARVPDLMGVVAEGNSVATAQLRRLLRDAGLGEALLCYPNERSASEIWPALWDTRPNATANAPSPGPGLKRSVPAVTRNQAKASSLGPRRR